MQDQEQVEQVNISSEDIDHIVDFFTYFGIEIPSYLQKEIDNFKQSEFYTIDMQIKLRQEIAHTLASSDHDIFQDEVFSTLIERCHKEWYDTQFDRDIENVLANGETQD